MTPLGSMQSITILNQTSATSINQSLDINGRMSGVGRVEASGEKRWPALELILGKTLPWFLSQTVLASCKVLPLDAHQA